MKTVLWDDGTPWDDPNLRWGDPSYLLEPGDPGYTPNSTNPTNPTNPTVIFPKSTQRKTHMKRQPYLPANETGTLEVLIALDTNLPALAAKYDVDDASLLRLRHGRHAYGWFVAAKPIAQQWSKSLTEEHESMHSGTPAPSHAMPPLPALPPVPTFTHNAATVTAQMEPGFFDFLGRFVQSLKSSAVYEEADGLLLKIVGAESLPPNPEIIPDIKWKIAPSGRPIIVVKKMPFQGYTVWVQIGTAPIVEAGFATTRQYELNHPNLPQPSPSQMTTWKVQVQYRYKNAPFGQKSQWIEIPVRG